MRYFVANTNPPPYPIHQRSLLFRRFELILKLIRFTSPKLHKILVASEWNSKFWMMDENICSKAWSPKFWRKVLLCWFGVMKQVELQILEEWKRTFALMRGAPNFEGRCCSAGLVCWSMWSSKFWRMEETSLCRFERWVTTCAWRMEENVTSRYGDVTVSFFWNNFYAKMVQKNMQFEIC